MRRTKIKKQKVSFDFKNAKGYILGGVCGILAIACIFMTIETATTGAEIANLQTKQTQALVKQRELQEELVQALSVNKLQEQSSTLGFNKIQNLVYVTDTAPVAKLSN
jgi:hypothetical protein